MTSRSPELLRRLTYALALVVLVPELAAGQDREQQDAEGEDTSDESGEDPATARATELFMDNCASCHGETGDGQGWTELDRPARSFMDGGFSFGNTPEALYRTISVGIPGTPMPGFDTSLTEEERRLLADHVVTLGPPVEEVDISDTVLTVEARARIVRGMLPPITEGAAVRPRGLLIGTTDGFTFEYSADDVRLIGVRQGDFVRRTDWTGRGGSALEPLGQVVHVVENGAPREVFRLHTDGDPIPLAAELTATRVEGARASVAYRLLGPEGRVLGRVEETPQAWGTDFGSGFVRKLHVQGVEPGAELWLRLGDSVPVGAMMALEIEGGVGNVTELEGLHVCTAVLGDLLWIERLQSTNGEIEILFTPGIEKGSVFEIVTLVMAEWSDEIGVRLEQALKR